MNKLLDEEKAIVTDIEGTTRDIIEGTISLNGIKLDLIDTAGIRETNDVVESIGVKKSFEYIEKADLILFLVNNNEELTQYDREILQKIKEKNYILIINKIDLPKKININSINEIKNCVEISTINDIGIDQLKKRIIDMYNLEEIEGKDITYLTNARGIALMKICLDSIKDIKIGIEVEQPIDMIEIDIKKIWDLLGEIIGETYQEELINQLFSQFCLGK